MSKKSEQFEMDCTNYLNRKYGSLVSFHHMGKSDSTKPDIKVSNRFFMEVKLCPAQCGQFVLLPSVETRTFRFSKKNDSKSNQYTEIIAKHMNEDFEAFKESGTSGKKIIFDGCKEVFFNWIMDYYNNKEVKYFIVNNYTILPVEKIHNYFNITATYRVKRSGSGSVGKSNLNVISNYIRQNFDVTSITEDGTKLFVTANKNMHDTRFVSGKYEYMFSIRDDKYEIRKLSNTINANVIFSINLEPSQKQEDLDMFESDLT